MTTRVKASSSFIKIGAVLGALVVAGCADFDERNPLGFTNVQIAGENNLSAAPNHQMQNLGIFLAIDPLANR
jgi:hypothetical protein